MVCHKMALAFCCFASFVLCSNGFEFHWCETTSFNKRLECSVDANTSSQDIFTIIDLTIFDVTSNSTSVKLAAISVLDTDLYIRHVSKSYLAVEGSISQHDAELVVPFNNQTYCSFCAYMCELNFINSAGHPVVRHITVKSSSTESGSSYNNVSVGIASQMMVAAVDRLTSIIHNVEDRLIKIAAVNEKTENRLTEMAAIDEKTENRLAEMAAIDERTENRLAEMTAIDEKTKNRLTEMAAIDEKTQNHLKEMSAANEESQMALARLEEKLDNITALLTSSLERNKEIKGVMKGTELDLQCRKGMASETDYSRDSRILVTFLDNKPALCDTDTDGGGWIIFQRRTDGRENFYRTWEEYKEGFGDVEGGGDYWLGLQSIHEITSKGRFELRVELEQDRKTYYYAQYSEFFVGNIFSKYRLQIGKHSGNATDWLTYHNDMPFTTHDKDNDQSSRDCAVSYRGAWWYNNCYKSNLNGVWGESNNKGINWNTGHTQLLTFTEMKMRQIS